MPTIFDNRNAALGHSRRVRGIGETTAANPNVVNAMGDVAGLNRLSGSAMDIIGSLLGGESSPSTARRANAYWGAGSGLGSSNSDPTGDFLARRGFDLYNDQGKADQQTGIKDLISLIGGMSGALIPTTGQNIQDDQFQQDFNYRQERDLIGDEERRSARRVPLREYSMTSGGDSVGRPLTTHYRYFS